LIVLFGLVLLQSALLLGVVVLRVELPKDGIVLPPLLELYASIALSGLAGVGLGLAVSAVAATPDKATSFIPIVLVPQVVLAGIMFALTGVMSIISWAVSSRAAVDALSATVDTNHLPMLVPMPDEPQYAHTPRILLAAWAALVGQAFVFSAIAWLTLRRRR
jgi:hypothetical protein